MSIGTKWTIVVRTRETLTFSYCWDVNVIILSFQESVTDFFFPRLCSVIIIIKVLFVSLLCVAANFSPQIKFLFVCAKVEYIVLHITWLEIYFLYRYGWLTFSLILLKFSWKKEKKSCEKRTRCICYPFIWFCACSPSVVSKVNL